MADPAEWRPPRGQAEDRVSPGAWLSRVLHKCGDVYCKWPQECALLRSDVTFILLTDIECTYCVLAVLGLVR